MVVNIGRLILGILAGLVVAWLVIALCEFASVFLHRPPPGVDLRDPQALAAHIDAAPLHARLVVVVGWSLAAFLGCWVAARIARHRWAAALIVAAFVVLIVIAKNIVVPHPQWMAIVGVLLPIPLAWIAARMATPRTPR